MNYVDLNSPMELKEAAPKISAPTTFNVKFVLEKLTRNVVVENCPVPFRVILNGIIEGGSGLFFRYCRSVMVSNPRIVKPWADGVNFSNCINAALYHASIWGAGDEAVSITGECGLVGIHSCILANTNQDHSCAFLSYGNIKKLLMVGNILSGNNKRNPRCCHTGLFEFTQNVVHDWGSKAMELGLSSNTPTQVKGPTTTVWNNAWIPSTLSKEPNIDVQHSSVALCTDGGATINGVRTNYTNPDLSAEDMDYTKYSPELVLHNCKEKAGWLSSGQRWQIDVDLLSRLSFSNKE